MLLSLIFYSFLSSASDVYSREVCIDARIPIEGYTQVVESTGARSIVQLFYRIELCKDGDWIFLESERPNHEFVMQEQGFLGKIDTLYLPEGVDPASVAKLAPHIKINTESTYRSAVKGVAAPGELRFNSGSQLHSLQIMRGKPFHFFGDDYPSDKNLEHMPFLALDSWIPCSPAKHVQLVQTPPMLLQNKYYSLWTVRTSNAFELTTFVELGSHLNLPLINAYAADANGKLLVDSPRLEGKYLYFADIGGRKIVLSKMEVENETEPLSRENWLRLPHPPRGAREFSAFFVGSPQNRAAQRTRDLFTARIPRETILEEWTELLTSPELRPYWRNTRGVNAHASELARDILFQVFPKFRAEALRESADSFASATGQLLIAGMMTPEQLRISLEEQADRSKTTEAQCMRMLKRHVSREVLRTLPAGILAALRKASVNFQFLRRHQATP